MDEDKEQAKKLKELETSLARELDQQVKLSEPTDSLMTGGVELNPTLNLERPAEPAEKPIAAAEPPPKNSATIDPVPPPEAPKPANPDGEISLEDLDTLLQQESPELQKEIDSLRKAGEDAAVGGADLSQFDVDADVSDTGGPGDSPGSEKIPLFRRLKLAIKAFLAKGFNGIMDFLYTAPIRFYKYAVKFLRDDLKGNLVGLLHKISHWLDVAIESMREMNWSHRLLILGMILIPALVVALLTSDFEFNAIGKTGIHQTFRDTPSVELIFDNTRKFVPLSDEAEFPQHVVLLQRIVVNLRPSKNSSPNPMVAARLYFEISTRDGAIEVKDREKEMRDMTERVLETFNYDQLVSAEGKKTFKETLRREITSVLNNGTVKNIYIDDILLKP